MNLAKCPICGGKIKLKERKDKNEFLYECVDGCMRGEIKESPKAAFNSWCKEAYKYVKIITPQSK